MPLTECFKILNLKAGADINDVKTAYKRLSMKYHPDKNDGDFIAGEMFKRIKDAYLILKEKYEKDPNYINQQELLKAREAIKQKDFELYCLRDEVKKLRLIVETGKSFDIKIRNLNSKIKIMEARHRAELDKERQNINNERQHSSDKIMSLLNKIYSLKVERDALRTKFLTKEQLELTIKRDTEIERQDNIYSKKPLKKKTPKKTKALSMRVSVIILSLLLILAAGITFKDNKHIFKKEIKTKLDGNTAFSKCWDNIEIIKPKWLPGRISSYCHKNYIKYQ